MIETTDKPNDAETLTAASVCGWCKGPIPDEGKQCDGCGLLHHEACWQHELGCSAAGCINAPLKRLDAPDNHASSPATDASPDGAPRRKRKRPHAAPETPSMWSGRKPCVDCGQQIFEDDQVCDFCFAINTPDGIYHGPTKTHPEARNAFVTALIGIVFCGVILGPRAIGKANAAKLAIRRDPRYSGEGLCTAATILGVIDVVVFGLGTLLRLGNLGR